MEKRKTDWAIMGKEIKKLVKRKISDKGQQFKNQTRIILVEEILKRGVITGFHKLL